MIGDQSEYRCLKCDGPLTEGAAATGRNWTFPLLACWPCNAVYTESFLNEHAG